MIPSVPISPPETAPLTVCFHCGTALGTSGLVEEDKAFCCAGCQTVFHLLHDNGLGRYYQLGDHPGTAREEAGRYASLDDERVAASFYDYRDTGKARVRFRLPNLHCAACIWLLEHLYKLAPGVMRSEVDFPRQEVTLVFDPAQISLREVAELLDRLGYPPEMSYADAQAGKKQRKQRKDWYDLGIAGFCFGNVMMLSFPEYLGIHEPTLARLFQWVILGFSTLGLFSARSYLKGAWQGIRHRQVNMDVPIALGIAVLYGRSALDIVLGWGPGYFDSMTGLVFFLLIGKVYQQKTYHRLSFERDFRSYFPLSVTRLRGDREEESPLDQLETGDRVLVRHGELIPADGQLLSGKGEVDYSFVTGEADPVAVAEGEQVFAGGRQMGGPLEMVLLRPVEQGYLSRLWEHDAFGKQKEARVTVLSGRVAAWFTPAVLGIALVAGLSWVWIDPAQVWPVVSAVLIVACPCALSLSTPFTLGQVLRIFGRRGLYLKGPAVAERLAGVDAVVFDKTGTLTHPQGGRVAYHGDGLSTRERLALKAVLRSSSHPLSRQVYRQLAGDGLPAVESFEEVPGQGLQGWVDGSWVRLGSAGWLGQDALHGDAAEVHVGIAGKYRGRFEVGQEVREGMGGLMQSLRDKGLELALLSGDPGREQSAIRRVLPEGVPGEFGLSPGEKLDRIGSLQAAGRVVAMVGDGLNDAGALAQSDLGIAVTDSEATFTPASDAILRGEALRELPRFRSLAQKGLGLIRASFVISFGYNLVGLWFAVTGQLSPLIAAVLMPASSLTVVLFATLGVRWWAHRIFSPSTIQHP